MSWAEEAAAVRLLDDPRTQPQALANIAMAHPRLRARVAQHPNAYPELIAWIGQQSRAPGAPGARPRKRRVGLMVALSVIIAAAVAAVLVLVLVQSFGGGAEETQRSASSSERADEGEEAPDDPEQIEVRGPENMRSGGFVIGEDLELLTSDALQPGEQRVATSSDRSRLPLDITVYLDYNSPHVNAFAQENDDVLEGWVGSGLARVEIYPVAFQDTDENQNNSTRTANLMACAADAGAAGDAMWEMHRMLLEGSYERGASEGHTDSELREIAAYAGQYGAEFEECVDQVAFEGFIAQNTAVATDDGVLGLADGARLSEPSGGMQPAGEAQVLKGVPLIVVNGVEWKSTQGEFSDFEAYLLEVQAAVENAR